MSIIDFTEKEFVLKHTFKNVINMKEGETIDGPIEEHFNIPWSTKCSKLLGYVDLKLDCKTQEKWKIETIVDLKLMKALGTRDLVESKQNYPSGFMNRLKLFSPTELSNYTINGNLFVEIRVKILGIYGQEIQKVIDFSHVEFSDVVLVVKNQKFNVNKMYLSFHSTYFSSLFSGNFAESQKSEIELKDINAQDFQNFLELIYGESEIKENTVDGILKLADFFDSKIPMKRCEGFLMEKSSKKYTEKFKIAVKYNLENLKKKCLPELKTAADIRSILPEDVRQFDYSVWNELLLKALDFSK